MFAVQQLSAAGKCRSWQASAEVGRQLQKLAGRDSFGTVSDTVVRMVGSGLWIFVLVHEFEAGYRNIEILNLAQAFCLWFCD